MARILAGALCAALLTFALPAPAANANTITDIVAASGGEFDKNRNDYDILLTAVITAGLAETLADPDAGFTVFAPNDRSFIRLARDLGFRGRSEQGAWEFLVAALTDLGGGNPIPVLESILLYHVVPAPVNVFGFFIAGIIYVFLKPEQVARYFGGRGARPVVLSALVGIPIPL